MKPLAPTKRIPNKLGISGIARSGEPRGDSTKGGNLLDGWNVDFSNRRTNVTETEIMRLLLSIKLGKRPGPGGVCGEAYKCAAVVIAPAFLEAFGQLKDPTYDFV